MILNKIRNTNHEYRNKIANESRIIRVKWAGIMNIQRQMIPLPPPNLKKQNDRVLQKGL